MNVLDQASSAILPLITGLILDYFSRYGNFFLLSERVYSFRTACCAFVIVYNVVSWIIEGRILLAIYRDTPTLKERSGKLLGIDLEGLELTAAKSDIDEDEENCTSTSWLGAFVSYFEQKAWRPAFALAMLYFTVLGFDNVRATLIFFFDVILFEAGHLIRRQTRTLSHSPWSIQNGWIHSRTSRKHLLHVLREGHGSSAYCTDRIFREFL